MRTIVRAAILADTTLTTTLGVTAAGVMVGDVDTPAARPFLNLKWGEVLPSVKRATPTRTTLSIWVHDTPWDYARIVAILARLRTVLPAIEGEVDVTGIVQTIEWTSNGPDLQDDGHRTIVKVGNYLVVGSE